MTTLSPPINRSLSTTLYFRQGASDKVYSTAVEPKGTGFIVTFAFGRRGGTLTTGCKTPSPVPYDDAVKIFNKLVREKAAKGYTPGEAGTPYTQSPQADRVTGLLPQLLNPITEAEVDRFLADDDWLAQEKFDGRRLLIRRDGDQITGINRRGLEVGLPATIATAIARIDANEFVLDGEAMGDVYHAFDLLTLGNANLKPYGYLNRYRSLVDLLDGTAGDAVRYAKTADGRAAKTDLLHSLRAADKEGIVFKHKEAPYAAGRPASGGPQRKLKFWASASCRVAGVNAGRKSVALELFEGGRAVAVGSVTIPANEPVPQAGSVVEVRYLYAYPGGKLYQPIYQGRRDDVVSAECGLGQLKFKPADDVE